MLPPAVVPSSRRGRVALVAALLLITAATIVPLEAGGAPEAITVEPRIVTATLGRVSLEQVDVSLRVALRASQAATIRSIAFTDAFVGQVPVWISRVEGEWPLQPGQELVIPEPMQVRIHARDALGADDLGAIVRKGTVTVRASVEVGIATPWLGRLLLMGPRRTVVRELALEMPIHTGASYLGPLARIGADLADAAQRGAATWVATGLNHLPARSAMVLRFGGSVAAVTSRYAIEGGRPPSGRERTAAGVWWNAAVFCTTREVLEPWRFDVADATALQLTGARLRREGGGIHIAATAEHPARDIALAVFDELLPSPAERKLYTLLDGRTRRLRLGDRDAASNLVCVRMADPAGVPASLPTATGSSAPRGGDVAAFTPGRSLGIVWTSVAATPGGLRIAMPVHRLSFGSPLVSGDGVVGLVASPTTAWPAPVVAAVAARAPRLPSTAASAAPAGR